VFSLTIAENLIKATNSLLGKFQMSMTLRSMLTPSQSTYDDVTYSSTDSTVLGFFLTASAELSQETHGAINVGDVIVYFKNDVSVKERDQIQYNSLWYEVKNVMPRKMTTSNTLIFTLCRLAPINVTS